MTRPLKVGIQLPEVERVVRWPELAEMARTAERIGLDSIWVGDHLLYRDRGPQPVGPWEAWSQLAALAAITTRVELGPLVASAGFHNPAVLAAKANAVDEISGGRLILGLGAGWHEPEYAAFGFPYDHRVSRFEEALQIITALLRTGHVDFQGAYYTARDCELRPRGPRPEGLPILVGGSGQRMLRLTARYADAWNADRQNDVARVQALNARVDQACQDEGRDPASLSRIIGIQVDLLNESRQPVQPRQWVMAPWPLTGTPQELAAQIRRYAEARVEHMMVWIDPVSLAGIEAFAPVLEVLDRGE
jgi:alkanesulfonate monooxygenase SsuD/methylene tetrahydromethanopterin reductase-like flavin-dependent oxidoreductase (luciferase family)